MPPGRPSAQATGPCCGPFSDAKFSDPNFMDPDLTDPNLTDPK